MSNAFTSAFKELDPIPQFRATAKLGTFFATPCQVKYHVSPQSDEDGDYSFNNHNDNPIATRFRSDIDNALNVEVWPSLSFAPTYGIFVYSNWVQGIWFWQGQASLNESAPRFLESPPVVGKTDPVLIGEVTVRLSRKRRVRKRRSGLQRCSALKSTVRKISPPSDWGITFALCSAFSGSGSSGCRAFSVASSLARREPRTLSAAQRT